MSIKVIGAIVGIFYLCFLDLMFKSVGNVHVAEFFGSLSAWFLLACIVALVQIYLKPHLKNRAEDQSEQVT